MHWNNTFIKIKPYVVKVDSPDGSGTGFFFAANKEKDFVAIATALHVIEDAHTWNKPIRLTHAESGEKIYLEANDRAILTYGSSDCAAIVFQRQKFPFPDEPLPMIARDEFRSVGCEVGWVGYPNLSPQNLCFFRGAVSAFILQENYYLIDGVAIHGVSGGPVFGPDEKGAEILGLVSAYWPNRHTSESLPGLLKAYDVSDLHQAIETLGSFGEAVQKEENERAAEPQTKSKPAPSPE